MHTYPELQLHINGEWRTTADSLPVVNPATEHEIGRVPVATTADLDDALAAASAGFAQWSQTSPKDRADLVRAASALMRERQDEIAHSITLEHGKPFRQAQLEVIRGCEFFEWDAGEAVRTYGRVIPSGPGVKYIVHHLPIGPVAAFSPWNFPMSQPARKIAGAVASGCSIILKAAEETPAGAMHIVKAFEDVGLPPGVLNLVFGVPGDISDYLIPSDTINLVAFTGSTAVGRHLTGMASDHMTPVLMELGGACSRHRLRGHRCRISRRHVGHPQDAQRRTGLHLSHPLLRARRGVRPVPRRLHPSMRGDRRRRRHGRRGSRWGRSPTTAGSPRCAAWSTTRWVTAPNS